MGSPPPEEAKANPDEEERLRSLILSLETESGILERVVYKNKNQHRRCPYFQALLKVRRDVRLLHSARLGEVLHHLFPVINGRKPAQKAYLPMRTKKNDPSGKHNYQDRLLGVARLLSQMAEPILKAAIQISLLLAKSFFTGFSVTILALLARLRVLAQQILLDVVSVFNKVSSLSQKKQSVKLTDEGIKAFREYYPSSKDVLTLECVWEEDKFVLLERTNNNIIKNQDEDQGVLPPETPIQYETMELFSEARSTEDDFSSEKIQSDLGSSFNLSTSESVNLAASQECPTASLVLNPKADSLKKRVAFVSVKKPRPTDMSMEGPSKKMKLDPLVSDDATKIDDPYLNLLLGGSRKNDTLF